MLGLLLVAAALGLSNLVAAIGIGVSGIDARTRLHPRHHPRPRRAAHWIGAALLITTGLYTFIQAMAGGQIGYTFARGP